MLRIKDIQKSLKGVVGWDYDGIVELPESMSQTSSGLSYQGGHPMVTLSNLKQLSPQGLEDKYKDWNESVAYYKGDVVHRGESFYKAVQNVKGIDPSTDFKYWTRFYPFNEWLQRLETANISKVANRLYSQKLTNASMKTIHDHKFLFDGVGRLANTIDKTRSIVGLELEMAHKPGVTIKVNKIGLQFTKPGAITIYVMHSSQVEPIHSFRLERKSSGSMEWFDLPELVLPYWSADTDAGGAWYICYDEDELADDNKAVNKEKNWTKAPCTSCSRGEREAYEAVSPYVEVTPFRTKPDRGDFNEDFNSDFEGNKALAMWDVALNNYTINTNYGLNLCISVHCDLTDYITMHKEAFAEVLQLQMAETVIRMLAFNPNANISRSTFNVDPQMALYELDGDTQGRISGITHRLNEVYKGLDRNVRGLNTLCLPCARPGVKFTSV